jgi:lipopolysaccharide export system protein LptA
MCPKIFNKTCAALMMFVLALAATGVATAIEADRDKDVDIESGYWVDDPDKGFVLFSQGVTMDQGTLHIEADKATVYRDDDGGTFSRIILEGGPARWSETLDDGALIKAQARHIDYNLDDETVVLRQEVIINKDGDQIAGELIRYNLKTQLLSGGGDGATSGRVKMTVSPKKKTDSEGDQKPDDR